MQSRSINRTRCPVTQEAGILNSVLSNLPAHRNIAYKCCPALYDLETTSDSNNFSSSPRDKRFNRLYARNRTNCPFLGHSRDPPSLAGGARAYHNSRAPNSPHSRYTSSSAVYYVHAKSAIGSFSPRRENPRRAIFQSPIRSSSPGRSAPAARARAL